KYILGLLLLSSLVSGKYSSIIAEGISLAFPDIGKTKDPICGTGVNSITLAESNVDLLGSTIISTPPLGKLGIAFKASTATFLISSGNSSVTSIESPPLVILDFDLKYIFSFFSGIVSKLNPLSFNTFSIS